MPTPTTPHPFVRVHNNGDHEIRTKYVTGNPLQIPAYGYMIVPWDTACFICGDPYLQDLNPRHTPRAAQFNRLKIWYGISNLNDDDAVPEFPPLTVQTPDGEEIPMLMHDPHGLKAPWRDPTAASPEVDALRRQIEELARSQSDLLALLAAREQVSPSGVSGMGTSAGGSTPTPPEADDDDITFDTPRRTRISGTH